jgi:hypothetical protein
VNTCDDVYVGNPGAHTGSLRFAAAMAGSGDTIDLSQLACSVISLKNGAIALTQDDIALIGPGRDQLLISGKYGIVPEHDRIVRHSGAGSLKISDLSIRDGYLDANAYDRKGGCIRSQGNVVLDRVEISDCRTYAPNAAGGAIVTKGDLWLLNSAILLNEAGSANDPSAVTYGGGAYVLGDLLAINSTISYNAARAAGDGGGAVVRGNAYIYYSTIAANSATGDGGGLQTRGNLTLANSTVSGNSANTSGAADVRGLATLIENSTITLNTANELPGIGLRPYQPMAVSLQSSMITGNTFVYNGSIAEDDIGQCCAGAQATVTFNGAHNLVRTPTVTLPAGVATTGVCALLGSLHYNGGPTRTHALLSRSPGIDAGDAGTFSYDQRGFLRISGNGADVGAYEIDRYDVIFNNGFDGCP